MQNAAFAAAGLDWEYVALEVAPAGLHEAVERVAREFAGANVTIPHKLAVAELCDEADGESVNTLVIHDDRVLGYNTDKEIVAGIEAQPGLLFVRPVAFVTMIGEQGADLVFEELGLVGRNARLVGVQGACGHEETAQQSSPQPMTDRLSESHKQAFEIWRRSVAERHSVWRIPRRISRLEFSLQARVQGSTLR